MLVFLNGLSGLCRFQFGAVVVSGLGCLTLRASSSSSSSSLSEAFEYASQRRSMSQLGSFGPSTNHTEFLFSCSNFSRDQWVYHICLWSVVDLLPFILASLVVTCDGWLGGSPLDLGSLLEAVHHRGGSGDVGCDGLAGVACGEDSCFRLNLWA